MENRFNLIDEPWVPVADAGRVSLRQIFEHPQYAGLGGNPVQKIALMKLLLAIAQAAATPADQQAWRELDTRALAARCLAYLEQWHDRFYLFGDKPFLQMPDIAKAKLRSYGAVLPEIAAGNTTVLSQIQVERRLDDASKALLLVTLMAFALAGKQTDNSVVLTPGYRGKCNDKGNHSSGKPGSAVARMGLLHSFLAGRSLLETLHLNLLTQTQITESRLFPQGLGAPPWEQMPEGEDCGVAQKLKQSLQGRLVPLGRFCLLTEEGLHYSEGLAHGGYKDGWVDPTVAVNYTGKEPRALWTDPEKRPWRELTSLLAFLEQQGTQGFQCLQLRAGLGRARDVAKDFAIWSGGLRVRDVTGEQKVSGSDDFVESQVWLHSDMLGQAWFAQLKEEMSSLDDVARSLYGRVAAYYKEQKVDGSKVAGQSVHMFWQLCERDFQALADHCGQDQQGVSTRAQLRRKFAAYAHQAYDRFCPRETARQLDHWAKCRPNHNNYLQQEA
jgi:CRISPR system Cascade subunit CasA